MIPPTESTPELDSAIRVPPRYWWLKRILIASGALVLLLVALRWWWGWEAERRLQAEIARIQAAGEPIYPEDFDPPEIPDDQNAALLLIEAAKALSSLTAEQTKFLSNRPPFAEWGEQEWLMAAGISEATTEIRDLIHRARCLPRADWGVRIRSPAINTMLPRLGDQKRLARLLTIQAAYENQVNTDAAAIGSLRDQLALGASLDQTPILVAHLVAAGSIALAPRSVEIIAPDLSAIHVGARLDSARSPAPRAEVIALVADFLDDVSFQENLVRSMHQERTLLLDTVQLLTSGEIGWLAVRGFGWIGPSFLDQIANFIAAPAFKLDGCAMMQHMESVNRAARQRNWPAAQKVLEPLERETDLLHAGLNPLVRAMSRYLLSSLDRAIYAHYRSLAERRMAAIALAIRLYEIDHGHRPEVLADLVPEYLPAVPLDPMSGDGREIGYLPDAPRPILYSVGLDGIDDGGKYSDGPGEHVAWGKYDIPFFLNGDRPPPKGWVSRAKQSKSVQADENKQDVESEERDDDENETAEEAPQ